MPEVWIRHFYGSTDESAAFAARQGLRATFQRGDGRRVSQFACVIG